MKAALTVLSKTQFLVLWTTANDRNNRNAIYRICERGNQILFSWVSSCFYDWTFMKTCCNIAHQRPSCWLAYVTIQDLLWHWIGDKLRCFDIENNFVLALTSSFLFQYWHSSLCIITHLSCQAVQHTANILHVSRRLTALRTLSCRHQ